jgi:hypothetical protein
VLKGGREMKIRDLVVLLITIALGTLSASAQEGDGSLTFTDHANQSVTINRFGTVLKLRNSNGKETVPVNVYRVCSCGEKEPCIDSVFISKETKSQFEVEFPKKGTTLKEGEALVVTATFRQGDLSVKRRLNWKAGSSSVEMEQVVSGPKSLCACTFEQKPEIPVLRFEAKMCPRPPGSIDWYTCPPDLTDISNVMMSMLLLYFQK